jgi:hypothetical protein
VTITSLNSSSENISFPENSIFSTRHCRVGSSASSKTAKALSGQVKNPASKKTTTLQARVTHHFYHPKRAYGSLR